LESGIWNLEFGIWNLEFGIWFLSPINCQVSEFYCTHRLSELLLIALFTAKSPVAPRLLFHGLP